jgi:hypothetical protein
MLMKEGTMYLKPSTLITVVLAMCLLCSGLSGSDRVFAQQGKGEAREGIYVIKKGDTLWDLSEKFLEDPFLWPKLWQENQYITNPHWIYPGNPIRFRPFEEVKVPAAKPAEIKPPGAKPAEVKPPEAKPEVARKPPVEEKPAEGVAPRVTPPEVALRPEAIPPGEERWAGFLTKEEFPGIGVVVESRERGRLLMAEGDVIYLAFKTRDPIEVGEQFTIFRLSPVIKHPLTGEKLGRKVSILGECAIIGAHDAMYTAHIFKSYRAIERGDRITHYRALMGR